MDEIFLSRSKLISSFLLLSIVLTTPLFYLLYTKNSEFKKQYESTQHKYYGTQLLQKIIPEYEKIIYLNDFQLNPVFLKDLKQKLIQENIFHLRNKEIKEFEILLNKGQYASREELSDNFYSPLVRSITNYSTLILDTELDSYYLIDIATLRVPRILSLLSRDSDFISIEYLLKQLQSEIINIDYSLKASIRYNEEFNVNKIQNSKELRIWYLKMYKEVYDQLSKNQNFNLSDLVKITNQFDRELHHSLIYILNQRGLSLKNHDNLIKKLTFGSWLLGMVFGFLLYYKVLKSQSLAFNKINQQQQLMQEAEKLSTLGELASSIIHEIKNPLTIIQYESNQTQKLVHLKDLDKTHIIDKLKKINNMSNRINKITNIISIYSRNSQNDPFQKESLKSIFDEVSYITSLKTQNNNIQLIIESTESTESMIDCRRVQIEQVLINLINNSIDAVVNLPEKWVKITTQKMIKDSNDFIKIDITDSGNGIKDSVADKIFESFYTSKDSGKGTGLGLSVSKSIINAHNGIIYYDKSASNTKFIIEIPVHNQEK
jgi:signal transduction histidine kinase